MAVTSLWRIKGGINKVILYAENEKKTEEIVTKNNDTDIKNLITDVIDYASREDATANERYVAGINCSTDETAKDMMEVKCKFKKLDGVVAYHGYMSFAENEVTPNEAFQIGKELAIRLWGDKYQVLVTCHLDKQSHIHCHFVLNTVSILDGKKYFRSARDYREMQIVADEICREHGLSVIENPKGKRISYDEYTANKNGIPTNNEIIINDIDECIAASVTMNEFYSRMKEKGYSFDNTHKYTTISHPKFNRPRRLKTLGEDYTESRIEARINKHLLPYEEEIPPQDDTDFLFEERYKSYDMPHLRFIYARYTFEINTWIERPLYNKYKLYLIKDDIKKLDRLADEQNVLIMNDLYFQDDITAFIDKCNTELARMDKERAKLRNQLKTAIVNGDENKITELKESIASYSEAMKKTRHEKTVCQKVLTELPELEEKVREVGRQNEKIRMEKEAKENESSGRFSRRNR